MSKYQIAPELRIRLSGVNSLMYHLLCTERNLAASSADRFGPSEMHIGPSKQATETFLVA